MDTHSSAHSRHGRSPGEGLTREQILALPPDQQERLLKAMAIDYAHVTGDRGWLDIFGIKQPATSFTDPVAEAVARIHRQGGEALDRLTTESQRFAAVLDAATIVRYEVVSVPAGATLRRERAEVIQHLARALDAKPVDHKNPANWLGSPPTPPGKGKRHLKAKVRRAIQCPWRHITLPRGPLLEEV